MDVEPSQLKALANTGCFHPSQTRFAGSDLPIELILDIWRYRRNGGTVSPVLQRDLHSLALINRVWNRAVLPTLYTHPQIFSASCLDKFLHTLQATQFGGHVTGLHIHFSPVSKNRRIWGFFKSRTAGTRDKALDIVMKACSNLTHLHLDLPGSQGEWAALSTLPYHPRGYISRVQVLSIGPSIEAHWLLDAISHNTVDCANLVELTLSSPWGVESPRWCPLPKLRVLRIVGSVFPETVLGGLLDHVAPTLEELTLEKTELRQVVPRSPLCRVHILTLKDIPKNVVVSSVLLISLPALETLRLSYVNAVWPRLPHLKALIFGEGTGRAFVEFSPHPQDVIQLISSASRTLTHLEIHDICVPEVPQLISVLANMTTTLESLVILQRGIFTQVFATFLAQMIALRSLCIICSHSTIHDYILTLPPNLGILSIHSLMHGKRLKDALFILLHGSVDRFPLLKSINVIVRVMDGEHRWLHSSLRSRCTEVGIHLNVEVREGVDFFLP